ncbi:MAG: ATP-dependent helicase [candidate division WOR-3 bacterium]
MAKSKSIFASKTGPILLLAGPGTGKTHQLALEIKYLIEKDPANRDKITVITFTDEAAKNMKNRLSDEEKSDVFLPPEMQPANISTMHSLGYRIIRENHSKVKLPEDIRVLTLPPLLSIMMIDAAQIVGIDKSIAKETEMCRRMGDYKKDSNNNKCKICAKYTELLRSCNAIDYDDQIIMANELLQHYPDILTKEQSRARYLLVDEYQDINAAQFRFINLLTKDQTDGLLVVGDDDQSIYSFRGGTPRFIRNFQNDYRNAKIEKKDICFRCPPYIFRGALEVVMRFDTNRLGKGVYTFKNQTNKKIVIYDVPSEVKEAEIIAQRAKELLPLGEVLILLPRWNFAQPLKKALRNKCVNYTCRPNIYESGLYCLQVIKTWLDNADDNFALRELLNALIEGETLNKTEKSEIYDCIAKIWNHALHKQISLFASLKELSCTSQTIENIYNIFDSMRTNLSKEAHEFLNTVTKQFGIWKNPQDFLQEIAEFTEELSNTRVGKETARVLTMHSAKGLEADFVFILGLDEGVFPTQSEMQNKDECAEAARLLFVSMTRAKRELYLFHARKRSAGITFLKKSYQLKQSPFIDVIPNDYITRAYVR